MGAHFWLPLSLVGGVRKPMYRAPLLVASKEKHGEATLQVLASLTCTPVPTRMHTQAQSPDRKPSVLMVRNTVRWKEPSDITQ